MMLAWTSGVGTLSMIRLQTLRRRIRLDYQETDDSFFSSDLVFAPQPPRFFRTAVLPRDLFTFQVNGLGVVTHAEDPERTAPRLQIPSSPDFGAAARPHQRAARTHMVTGPWPSPPTGAWVFEGPRRGAHVGARLPRRRQDRELGHGESDPEPTHEAARRLHESPPFPRLGCQLRNGSRRRRRSVVFRAPPFPPPLSPPPQGSSQADPLRSR
nr:uncharacterized protein LOC123574540 [Macaca fascicularis]